MVFPDFADQSNESATGATEEKLTATEEKRLEKNALKEFHAVETIERTIFSTEKNYRKTIDHERYFFGRNSLEISRDNLEISHVYPRKKLRFSLKIYFHKFEIFF